jgi:hypothetical protein
MPGQRVMQIADTSDGAEWELITFLPEKELGHFLRKYMSEDNDLEDLSSKNIKVSYILLNAPQHSYTGTLLNVQRSAELLEEKGVCYRLRIKVDKSDLKSPRPGAEVISRVHCGARPLGFVLLHDAWEWVQTNLLF